MTALTVAGLTVREAFRRRVIWALLVLTIALLALMAARTKTINLGTSIVNIWGRDAQASRMAAEIDAIKAQLAAGARA